MMELKSHGIIISSKSMDGVVFGEDTISSGSGLSPNPGPSEVVVVKISPKVILSAFGLGPVPRLLDGHVGPIHVGDVPPVSELREFSTRPEGCLAEAIASGVSGDVDAADGVSDCEDAARPPLVEGLVGIGVGSEVGVVVVEGPVEYFGVDDAKKGESLGAGGVSELRVAAVARHPPHEAVLLRWPDRRLERESLLVGNPLPIV